MADLNNNQLKGLDDGTEDGDATTKSQVDPIGHWECSVS